MFRFLTWAVAIALQVFLAAVILSALFPDVRGWLEETVPGFDVLDPLLDWLRDILIEWIDP